MISVMIVDARKLFRGRGTPVPKVVLIDGDFEESLQQTAAQAWTSARSWRAVLEIQPEHQVKMSKMCAAIINLKIMHRT